MRELLADIEVLVTHLTVLGYRAVMLNVGRASIIGITNDRQTFYVRYGHVNAAFVSTNRQFPHTKQDREVAWWRMTDDNLRLLAQHVDPTLNGGWTGD